MLYYANKWLSQTMIVDTIGWLQYVQITMMGQ